MRTWRHKPARFLFGRHRYALVELFISQTKFDLLFVAIDEAHHTKKGHVFNVIMKRFYKTLNLQERPKVLALSATLAEPREDISTTINATLEIAESLESSLAVPHSEEGKTALLDAINMPEIEFKKISAQPDFEKWMEVAGLIKNSHKVSCSVL